MIDDLTRRFIRALQEFGVSESSVSEPTPEAKQVGVDIRWSAEKSADEWENQFLRAAAKQIACHLGEAIQYHRLPELPKEKCLECSIQELGGLAARGALIQDTHGERLRGPILSFDVLYTPRAAA